MAAIQRRKNSVWRFELHGVQATGNEIGTGAYGTVEELLFQGLSCVGKSIHEVLNQGDGNILERFVGECKILSQLCHPNIVQFLGVYRKSVSQLPVLVMERMYCTLSDCIKEHGILPDESNYSILHSVAVGLSYLHSYSPNPIVHRDISANNVLLTSNLSAKISDLGVAKILNHPMSRMTKVPGTPAYMPPEVFLDEPNYSSKVDIFSYGCLMVHMFCGRWPFPKDIRGVDPDDSTKFIFRNEIQRRQPYLNDIEAQHPLMPLIHKCLCDHSGDRPDISEILATVKNLRSRFHPLFQNKVEAIERIKADTNEKAVLKDCVSSLLTEIKQKDNQIDMQAAEVDSLNDQLGNKVALLEANDSTIDKLNHQLAVRDMVLEDKDSVIANLSERLQQRITSNETKDCTINSLTRLATDLSKQVQALSDENAALNKKLLSDEEKQLCISEDRSKLLFTASKAGHSQVVEFLLSKGANPNFEEENGSTPLSIAAERGHTEVVEKLLNAGASTKCVPKNGKTALYCACWKGHSKIVVLLVEANADTNQQNKNGCTPLFVASQNGHTQVVEILLNNGADPDIQKKNGFTPLSVAAEKGHTEVIEKLLKANANPNLQSQGGETALFYASWKGYDQIVKLLLEADSAVNKQNKNGSTPLTMAAEEGHTKVVELLLRADANTKLQYKGGETALHYASSNSHEQIVQLLIEADTECVNQQKKDGSTPLLVASTKGNSQVVEILLQNGADNNLQNNNGWTPLIYAAKNGHENVVKLLLMAGASPDTQDQEKETAIMKAAQYGCVEIVSLLLQYGANTELKNMDGSSVLFIASQNDHHEVVKLLLRKKPGDGFQNQEQMPTEPQAEKICTDLDLSISPTAEVSTTLSAISDADQHMLGCRVLCNNCNYLFQHLETNPILQNLFDSGIITEKTRKQVQSYSQTYPQNIVLVRALFSFKLPSDVMLKFADILITIPGQEHIGQKLAKDYQHQRCLQLSGHLSQPMPTTDCHSSDLPGLSEFFLQTLRNVLDAFEQESIPLDKVKSVLSLLVLPLGNGKVAALVDPSAYANALTLRDLARCMAPYWNCVSTDVLRLLAEESSCSLAATKVNEFISTRDMKCDLVLAVCETPTTTTTTTHQNDDSGLSPEHKSTHYAPLEDLQSQHPKIFARLSDHCVSASWSVARISVEIALPVMHLAHYNCITQALCAFFKLPRAALVYCGCLQSPLIVCWEITTEVVKYITSMCPGLGAYRLLAEQEITGLAVADKIKYRCPSMKEVELLEVSFYGMISRIPDFLKCVNVNLATLNGYWAVHVPGDANRNLRFCPCPPGYCQCSQNSSLGNTRCVFTFTNSDPDLQCACGREGILCGKCRSGRGVSALLNRCVSCHDASGMLILALIVVDVVVFLGVALLDFPLPLWVYPFLFYLQLVPYVAVHFPESFERVGKYLFFISSALGFYFPYDFCLHGSMSALVSYTTRYIPVLVAAVVYSTVVIFRYLRHMKSLQHHGLWWAGLLLYTTLLHTSMSVLDCPFVPEADGSSTIRWFINGEVKCFTGGHLPLALLAIAVLLVCLALIPFTAAVAMDQLRRHQWLRQLAEPLTVNFKRELRWWSAVELGRRVLFLVFLIPFPRNTVAPMLVLTVTIAVYGFLQPYRSRWANAMEIFLLIDFLLLIMLRTTPIIQDQYLVFPSPPAAFPPSSSPDGDRCSSGVTGIAKISWILTPFYYIPLLVLAVTAVVYCLLSVRRRYADRVKVPLVVETPKQQPVEVFVQSLVLHEREEEDSGYVILTGGSSSRDSTRL